MPRTPAEALTRLIEALDRLEIPYAVAGSVASSAHGIPRTTLDVDLVVDFATDKIHEFAAELQGDFYVDADLIRESFARGRAANLIHLVTAWKFDLFPLAKRRIQPDRVRATAFREIQPTGAETVECAVASGEDTVLRKAGMVPRGRRKLRAAVERPARCVQDIGRTTGCCLPSALGESPER